ncbi:hypothetical protein PVK06_040775 [Gossypium arboreum]|uniref:Uncharacterized protein n=1 Tax=Gossypium arboreum TaxID=29729 RepID=A0ABR0N704_GOSAR|nr:hypothetical protein PVK06_040775 [Gossypium arboreum]
MVGFDLGLIIYEEIVKQAERIHGRYLLPFPSLIFQSSSKWLKGKHVTIELKDQPNDMEEEDPKEESIKETAEVPTSASTKVTLARFKK